MQYVTLILWKKWAKFSIKISDLPPNIELSEDPMNIIIDPQGLRTAAKGETMPRRKYFFAAVHIEFMIFKGMAIPVVEFSRDGYKIRKDFWLKNNCSQMKSLKFENWLQLIVCQKTCLILYPSLENSTTGIAIFKGKQEVYEISLICQDMSSIEVFIVPEAMKNDTATLEALGFTLNRNLNKYFYVQSGTGMLNFFFFFLL